MNFTLLSLGLEGSERPLHSLRVTALTAPKLDLIRELRVRASTGRRS